jgi:hypothetical protein
MICTAFGRNEGSSPQHLYPRKTRGKEETVLWYKKFSYVYLLARACLLSPILLLKPKYLYHFKCVPPIRDASACYQCLYRVVVCLL